MIERTRYGKIYKRDLSDWRAWHDGLKDRYEDPGFWNALDSKAVAATFHLPQPLGAIARIALAGLGPFLGLAAGLMLGGWWWLALAALYPFGTNRYEPSVVGNNQAVDTLWSDRHPALRWALWHLRNPCPDLRKFYTGFAYALDVDHRQRRWGVARWARFPWLPDRRIPFPVLKWSLGHIGWETRGILSAGVNL